MWIPQIYWWHAKSGCMVWCVQAAGLLRHVTATQERSVRQPSSFTCHGQRPLSYCAPPSFVNAGSSLCERRVITLWTQGHHFVNAGSSLCERRVIALWMQGHHFVNAGSSLCKHQCEQMASLCGRGAITFWSQSWFCEHHWTEGISVWTWSPCLCDHRVMALWTSV